MAARSRRWPSDSRAMVRTLSEGSSSNPQQQGRRPRGRAHAERSSQPVAFGHVRASGKARRAGQRKEVDLSLAHDLERRHPFRPRVGAQRTFERLHCRRRNPVDVQVGEDRQSREHAHGEAENLPAGAADERARRQAHPGRQQQEEGGREREQHRVEREAAERAPPVGAGRDLGQGGARVGREAGQRDIEPCVFGPAEHHPVANGVHVHVGRGSRCHRQVVVADEHLLQVGRPRRIRRHGDRPQQLLVERLERPRPGRGCSGSRSRSPPAPGRWT